MKIHEYQAKEILKKYNVAVPVGKIALNSNEAEIIAKEIQQAIPNNNAWAIKAQIHAGGRGKGGGVKIAKNIDEVKIYSQQIIGMNLITPQTGEEGKKVNKILVEQSIFYPNKEGKIDVKEFYLSILLDRKLSQNIIIYSPCGGMDIEEVAKNTPDKIFKEVIDVSVSIQSFQARRIAFNLELSGNAFKEMVNFVMNLYKCYESIDAALLEINPVFKTSDDKIFAADCKMLFDDNAIFRHKDYNNLQDLEEEDAFELEAAKYNLNFVKLDGNVGCMVNGAGLAMATMDMIGLSGGSPANFLDVGGTASAETVEAGIKIILKDANVKAILINIFGGIVRCDRVANGVVEACKNIGEVKVPIIVRLQGTNAEEAKKIISDSGLKVFSAVKLEEAADKVKEIMKISY